MQHCEVARLPFGGLCPPSELVCPSCPLETPIKCPGGGCVLDVRRCEPNVWLQGPCTATACTGVQQCHVLLHAPFACWEVWPSAAEASMRFHATGSATCSHCQEVRTRYPCSRCCSYHAQMEFNSSFTLPTSSSGAASFMAGSRWICMLYDVARRLGLRHRVTGLTGALTGASVTERGGGGGGGGVGGGAESTGVAPSPADPLYEVSAVGLTALDFPMPSQYDL